MGAGLGVLAADGGWTRLLAGDKAVVWVGITGVLALLSIRASLSAWRKRWEVDDTPTSTCRGVFVGRNEVAGRAVPIHEPLRSPFSGQPVVWFSWSLQRYQSGDDGGRWIEVESRASAAPFWIEDDTGRILVRPRGAAMGLDGSLTRQIGRDFAPPYSRWQLRQWVLAGEDAVERQRSLADPAFHELPVASTWFTHGTAEPLHALRGKLRVVERLVHAGRPVFVIGEARPRADAPGLELVADGSPLSVTTDSERQVAAAAGREAWWKGFRAAALSVVFATLLSNLVTGSIRPSWPVALVGAEALLLVGVALVRNYNRQITVKEQAAKAWSMIDVSLRRRADLLPQLAAVAERYAGHEHAVQAAAAALRAGPVLPPAQELPGEPALVQAETADRDQRAAAAGGFALAERYPDLRASDVFLDLQRRIVDAEEAVSSARTFYNDAINVLRDRRQQFPGSLFARLVPVPSWRLFEADEVARAPVAIAPALPPDDADPTTPGGPAGPGAGPPPQPEARPAPPPPPGAAPPGSAF